MKNTVEMFSFSSKFWYDKRWISAAGIASLYLQVVIDGRHKEFPLKLKWPVEKIHVANGISLRRKKDAPDVTDYNLLIMSEIAKYTPFLKPTS